MHVNAPVIAARVSKDRIFSLATQAILFTAVYVQ